MGNNQMTDSGVNSGDRKVKEEPMDSDHHLLPPPPPPPFTPLPPPPPSPPSSRSDDKSVMKLLEKVRQTEKERGDVQTQLLEMIDKYTEAENRISTLEDESRAAKENAARCIANLGRKETEKVIEWVNKYKTELAKNHASERRASESEEEMERLKSQLEGISAELTMKSSQLSAAEMTRKDLTEVTSRLETERERSKAILKSNMELSWQVNDLAEAKRRLEEGAVQYESKIQSLEQAREEAGIDAAVSASRAAQAEKELAEHKTKSEEEVNRLKNALMQADKEKTLAQDEAAAGHFRLEKMAADHEEMRKINGFLATTESGKIYEELIRARKRIEHLEKKLSVKPPDQRAECAQSKKRKTGDQ